MISERQQRLKYVVSDLLAALLSWCIFAYVRYLNLFHSDAHQWASSFGEYLQTTTVMMGFVFAPLMMMFVFYLSGYYVSVFRKSRLHELFITIISIFVIEVILFVVMLINDMVAQNRQFNYEILGFLYIVVFAFVYSFRYSITSTTSRRIKRRKWQFPTIIVGCSENAQELYQSLNNMEQSMGYQVVGFTRMPDEQSTYSELFGLPVLEMEQLNKEFVDEKGIKEIIVAPHECNEKTLLQSINSLFSLSLPIKITPNIYNILLSRVRLQELCGAPLMDISGTGMSDSEKCIKRAVDVLGSALGLVLLSPLLLTIATLVKLDSPGSIIFKQKRVGRNNKEFNLYKFRSMCSDAESDGVPMLSHDSDQRITKIGHSLRKYRLDELPQLWNVLIGDMSIVGPRPEREYFVKQILQRAPFYAMLHQVRPGLTSLGMVKFGYAKNVDEMVERMKYDLLYIENMTLLNDFKIMIYTVITIIQGKGI